MTFALDQAKLALADEYERTGRVALDAWLERLPQHAAELLDFAFALDDSPRRVSGSGDDEWVDEGGVAERALAHACSQLARSESDVEPTLALRMAQLRSVPRPPSGGKAPPSFKRAVINAWVVEQMRREQPGVSRIAVQKTTYLLERSLDLGLFKEHQRMRFGPYDPAAKYKDAEPIGITQGWIVRSGYNLNAGPNIANVHRYASNYLPSVEVATMLVQLLAERTPWELETWATVEAVATDLQAAGESVSAASILAALGQVPAWRDKLKRPNFSPRAIDAALQHLTRLGLLRP